MSKTGTDASTASTQLRQILATIAKPTNEANDALAEMGLSAEGLREQIKEEGLFSTLETLTDAFDGNIEATSEVFGNIRALSGVLDLMGASAEDNREVFNLLADDTGVLDEAFQVTADTAEFKFDRSMGLVKESLLGIGEDLLERLLPYLDRFNDFMEDNGPQIVKGFDKIFDAVEDVTEGIADFVGELKADPEFQEFVAQLGEDFGELWPEIKDAVFQLADLAEKLGPLAGETAKEAVDLISDLTTIMRGLAFFTEVTVDALDDLGINLQGPLITGLERALNPIKTLRDAVSGLADAFDRVLRKAEAAENIDTGNIQVPDRPAFTPVTRPAPITVPGFSLEALERTGAGARRRAMGGPVSALRGYMVGERGPELFVPSISGEIIPNNELSSGGGGNTYNVTVNAGMGAKGPEIGREVINAIRDYERRNGRVFRSV
jgi:hypothetical protein